MEDMTFTMFLGKVFFAAILGGVLALNLTSCGLTNGNVTLGTTSYLAEVGKQREELIRARLGEPMDHYSDEERAALNKELSK
jgi:hypothetical protein